jgi:putative membrane protein
MNPKLKRFIQIWLITAFAVLVTVFILRGRIRYETPADLLLAALLLGVLNAFIRPVLFAAMLPLVLRTLGLLMVLINGALLYLVHGLMGERFQIDGFWWAVLGSIIIGLISFPLQLLTGNSRTRIVIRRGRRPGNEKRDGDENVIDV